jgi:hypothetical protein
MEEILKLKTQVRLEKETVQQKEIEISRLHGQVFLQCFGSVCESGSKSTGSTCFWASWIRIILSSSNNSKKNLDSYCFVTSFGLFILEK